MRRGTAVIAAVVVAVGIVFWPAIRAGFVFDDAQYILGNPGVTSGLGLAGLRWAATSTYASNWHPLTWLSHQADVQLFGLDPLGPHAVNVLLHAANAVLLFLFLRAATGAFWRSACVTLLFALHPLRVETVAWVSQRKDLLATSFWFLALHAYVRHARRPDGRGIALVSVFFLLALTAKPMPVTLPAVLLLLDLWPLGRLRWVPANRTGRRGLTARAALAEKIPLIAAAAASAAVTLAAQGAGSAVVGLDRLDFSQRVVNALHSYWSYLAVTLWPAGLAVYYPHREAGLSLAVAAPAAGLAALSCAAVAVRRTRPWLTVGWLWCLGTLLPVIGLVQVGGQAMADRYTYVPLVGIFVAGVWGAAAPAGRRPRLVPAVAIACAVVVLALMPLTHRQTRFWRSNETLFRHALAVTSDNWVMEENLGRVLSWDGRYSEAVPHLRRAVLLRPLIPDSRRALAAALRATGRPAEAEEQLRAAARLKPAPR